MLITLPLLVSNECQIQFSTFGQNEDQVSIVDTSDDEESQYRLNVSLASSSVSLTSANGILPHPSSTLSTRKVRHLSVDSETSTRVKIMPLAQKLSLQEEVNQNLSIEMDSIKQIRDDHVRPLTLRFFLPEMESTVIQITCYIAFLIIDNARYFSHAVFYSSAICGTKCLNQTPSASSLSGFFWLLHYSL